MEKHWALLNYRRFRSHSFIHTGPNPILRKIRAIILLWLRLNVKPRNQKIIPILMWIEQQCLAIISGFNTLCALRDNARHLPKLSFVNAVIAEACDAKGDKVRRKTVFHAWVFNNLCHYVIRSLRCCRDDQRSRELKIDQYENQQENNEQ